MASGTPGWSRYLISSGSRLGALPAVAQVILRDGCTPATWQDRYTAQMLHVWVVPYPGGVFSDDLSATATNAAVHAVLAEHR